MDEFYSTFKKRLRAAEGFIELGMHLDADAELEEIEPEFRGESAVLQLRILIYCALRKWKLMQTVSKTLALRDPDNVQWAVSWAYATRRQDSIEAGRLILLEAVERLPEAAILHYNLACYECQLGEVEVAKARLKHAIKLDPNTATGSGIGVHGLVSDASSRSSSRSPPLSRPQRMAIDRPKTSRHWLSHPPRERCPFTPAKSSSISSMTMRR